MIGQKKSGAGRKVGGMEKRKDRGRRKKGRSTYLRKILTWNLWRKRKYLPGTCGGKRNYSIRKTLKGKKHILVNNLETYN